MTTDPTTSPAQDPVRDVFRRALRDMLALVAVVAVLGVGIGALVAEPPSAGVWGALIGVAITLLFSGTTVLSMLVTAGSSPVRMAGVVLGSWLAKMVLLIVLLVVLRDLQFYDRRVLVAVLLAGVLGSVLVDYRAVVKGRIPYTTPRTGPSV